MVSALFSLNKVFINYSCRVIFELFIINQWCINHIVFKFQTIIELSNGSYCNQCTKNEVFHKDFLSKCDRRKLWIWSQLLKKSLMENFVFLSRFTALPFLSICNKIKRSESKKISAWEMTLHGLIL